MLSKLARSRPKPVFNFTTREALIRNKCSANKLASALNTMPRLGSMPVRYPGLRGQYLPTQRTIKSIISLIPKGERKQLATFTLRRLMSTEAKPGESKLQEAQSTSEKPINMDVDPFESSGMPKDMPPADPEVAAALERRGFSWTRALIRLLLVLITALCYFELYCILQGEDWTAYLSFVPLLNWYPMLKIAEMSPLWMIFPALMAFLHRGTARALYATHNSAFLILGNVLMLVNLGAIYYRFYRLAEHFDVSPGWAAVVGIPFAPLITAAMVCNHDTYAPITPEAPKRPSTQRVSVVQFMSNAGERAVFEVEHGLDRSWLITAYASAYIFLKTKLPGFPGSPK